MFMKSSAERNCSNCSNMGNRSICDFFWIDENEICDSYKKKEGKQHENIGSEGQTVLCQVSLSCV